MDLPTVEPRAFQKTSPTGDHSGDKQVQRAPKSLTQPTSLSDLAGIVEDSLGELAQAKIRFGMNFFFAVLGLVAWYHDPTIGLAWVVATFLVCLGSASLL